MAGRGYAKGRGLDRVPEPSEALGSTDHMAPSFYHYLPVPMDEMGEKQGCGTRPRCLVAAILMVLLGVTLLTLTIYYAVTGNCKDGLWAQDECRNTTHLLQLQLTRTQDNLLQAETQANSCNRTVVRLESAPSSAPSDSGEALKPPSKSPTPTPEGQLVRIVKSWETLELPTALQSGTSVYSLPGLGGSPNFVESA